MVTERQPPNPGKPGPFQKYLLSGAYYTQVGRCYELAMKALAQNVKLQDNAGLADSMSAVWQQYLAGQSPGWTSFQDVSVDTDRSVGAGWPEKLQGEIRRAGQQAVDELLESLNQRDSQELELRQFFQLWVSACDRAYGELVRSESFCRAMGELFTDLFRILPSEPDLSQTAQGDGNGDQQTK